MYKGEHDACIVYSYRPKHRGFYVISLLLAGPEHAAEQLAASPYRVEVGPRDPISKLAAFGPSLEPLPLEAPEFNGALEPQLELGVDVLFCVEFNSERPPPENNIRVRPSGNRMQLADGGDGLLELVALRHEPDQFALYKFTPLETGVLCSRTLSIDQHL